MKDYEQILVPNEGSLTIDMICLTISESRVGVFPAVLEALDRPEWIMIHRGVRKNEGKLIVEGVEEYEYGAIPINYERKKISFYNKAFIGVCKEMIQKYGKGEFKPGIFYTVKGKLVEGNAIEFDFHTVLYREVKACKPDIYRKKGKAKKPAKSSAQAVKRSGSMTGFTMPAMGSAIGGMY